MSKRKVVIEIIENENECTFSIDASGMQRFEIIGILEVAKDTIKRELKILK